MADFPRRPPLAKVIEHPTVRAQRLELQADSLADALEELIEAAEMQTTHGGRNQELARAVERARVMLRAARGGKRFPAT